MEPKASRRASALGQHDQARRGILPRDYPPPAPLDMNILKALKRSSLGLDLYMWISYRTFTLKKVTAIRWRSLYRQFGAHPLKAGDKRTVDDFRKKCLRELKKIQGAWSRAAVRHRAGSAHCHAERAAPAAASRVASEPPFHTFPRSNGPTSLRSNGPTSHRKLGQTGRLLFLHYVKSKTLVTSSRSGPDVETDRRGIRTRKPPLYPSPANWTAVASSNRLTGA